MKFLKLVFSVCAIIFIGCEVATDCTTGLEPAITIKLKDKKTGSGIIEGKGFAILRDGGYVDTIEFRRHDIEMGGGYERAGKYSVEIEMEGYERWTKDNVMAPQGDCGPITQNIVAFLNKK